MAQIGLMIEGQDGLNWPRWVRLLKAAEDFGYQCLFRSDHFTNASAPDKDSLELWVSLVYAADHTQRIEFGPLVTPITFRHPAITARMAAAVDDLSGGRLVLGMGAGWQEREHYKFGVPFYDFPTRYARLTEGLEVVTRLLTSDAPVTFQGQYYTLDEAVLLPRPQRPGGPPILIGGNGPERTLPLVARYAAEWNAVFIRLETYQERRRQLDDLLDRQGRAPGSVKCSLMTQLIFGRDDADLRRKLGDRDADELVARGLIVGTAEAVIEQLGRFAEAGVERFTLQWLDQDNIADLELIARDVLPHFHGAG
ncbi:MAG: TIGR03560 family F420-dependent LLM class oxidoreductase [Chloroflexi bacterium]|nr:TIGR03560 family F420-dependent LLM class oxidoreductase [Chloroflexota bacterium]MDL1885407.1 TIGR03560 family F420-dependent LLM class oxidoreductase [Anaerolineae bacterium CFX8]